MSKEKSGILIKLDLARSNIRRYLEGFHESVDQHQRIPGNTPVVSTQSKKHTVLNLGHAYLKDDEFLELLPELKTLTLITELNLENNSLTGTSILALLEILPNLEKLHLWRNALYKNEGCLHLAKFTRLSYVDVSENYLSSEDFEKLQQSNSLLSVNFERNKRIDIVRKARLLGACDYNNKVRIQLNVGAAKMDCTKDDYIANNLPQFVKSVQFGESISKMINSYPPAEYYQQYRK